jgi:hypothetical protein
MLRSEAAQAEVPGLSKCQLEALTNSVELRRQQLEKDIRDYIKARQEELRSYEQEVCPPPPPPPPPPRFRPPGY